MEDRYDIVAELLVALKVAADKMQITADLAGPPRGHAAADAVAPGFIGGRQYHAAADGNGPVPK